MKTVNTEGHDFKKLKNPSLKKKYGVNILVINSDEKQPPNPIDIKSGR